MPNSGKNYPASGQWYNLNYPGMMYQIPGWTVLSGIGVGHASYLFEEQLGGSHCHRYSRLKNQECSLHRMS